MGNYVELDKKQIDSIDKIWLTNYGKKIPKYWHEHYTKMSGKFNENYFPEIFYTTNLLYKLNPPREKKILGNKAILYSYFKNLDFPKYKLPKYYFYCCGDFYYDSTGIISLKKAINSIENIGEVIIKPTVDSDSGRDVNLYNFVNGIDTFTKESVIDVLKKYKTNFIVQERIEAHESFKKLNATSINTIRITTYILEDKIYVCPILMRIGRNGSVVDNAHAGGLIIGIKDGKLLKKSTTEFGGTYLKHPDTGLKFENYKIPRIDDMIEFAKKYHHCIPYMGILDWDFTLDKDENIVLIETNMVCSGVWLVQDTTGEAFFGDNTCKMIQKLKK